jgi:hypothetical protein
MDLKSYVDCGPVGLTFGPEDQLGRYVGRFPKQAGGSGSLSQLARAYRGGVKLSSRILRVRTDRPPASIEEASRVIRETVTRLNEAVNRGDHGLAEDFLMRQIGWNGRTTREVIVPVLQQSVEEFNWTPPAPPEDSQVAPVIRLECPKCGSRSIGQERHMTGPMWCTACKYRIEAKEVPGNPFISVPGALGSIFLDGESYPLVHIEKRSEHLEEHLYSFGFVKRTGERGLRTAPWRMVRAQITIKTEGDV